VTEHSLALHIRRIRFEMPCDQEENRQGVPMHRDRLHFLHQRDREAYESISFLLVNYLPFRSCSTFRLPCHEGVQSRKGCIGH
jgi:hypothetical protein